MNWLIGAAATCLVAAGCILAYPGQDGRHLAGLALIIAGMQCAAYLLKQQIDKAKEK